MSDRSGGKGAGGLSPRVYLIIVAAIILVAVIGVSFVLFSSGGGETPAPATLDAAAQQGKTLYQTTGNCGSCHPSDGRAGSFTGPRLSTINLNEATIRQYIRLGKGGMPGNTKLTDDDITKIIAYLNAIKAAAATTK